jgi:hypothetical protein
MNCGKEVTEGFIYLNGSAYGGALYWTLKEPKSSDDFHWNVKIEGSVALMRKVASHWKEQDEEVWSRKAFWCPKCNMIAFLHNPPNIPEEERAY